MARYTEAQKQAKQQFDYAQRQVTLLSLINKVTPEHIEALEAAKRTCTAAGLKINGDKVTLN